MTIKLRRISGNVRELVLTNGARMLISYSTPVALYSSNNILAVTDKKWSSSTSRQIQKYRASLDYPKEIELSQDMLNQIALFHGFNETPGEWKEQYSNKTYPVREFNNKNKRA